MGPVADAVGGPFGEVPAASEAVLDLDCQRGAAAARRAFGDVVADACCPAAGQFAVDVGVEVAAVEEVLEVRHIVRTRRPPRLFPWNEVAS